VLPLLYRDSVVAKWLNSSVRPRRPREGALGETAR
jgi:hypothetical protein